MCHDIVQFTSVPHFGLHQSAVLSLLHPLKGHTHPTSYQFVLVRPFGSHRGWVKLQPFIMYIYILRW